jgi:hypothetical protein
MAHHCGHSAGVVGVARLRGARGRGADDGHRATGVAHAVQSYRTQQYADHGVVTAVAYRQQIGGIGGVASDLPGPADESPHGDHDTGTARVVGNAVAAIRAEPNCDFTP